MGIHKKELYRSCILGFTVLFFSACGESGIAFTPSQAADHAEKLQVEQVSDGRDGSAIRTGDNGDDGNAGNEVYVHVCGAVREPGLKKLPAGSRVWDALELAGGFAEEADEAAVNLAAFLEDGSKIYFPTREETEGRREEQIDLIGINTADEKTLLELPGIGSAKAKAILNYRKEHGRFSKAEELLEVSGISEGIFEQIKDLIRID